MPGGVKFTEMERGRLLTGGRGKGLVNDRLTGTEFLFGEMQKLWRWVLVMAKQCYECTLRR